MAPLVTPYRVSNTSTSSKHVMTTWQTTNPVGHRLAQTCVNRCKDKLQPHITNFVLGIKDIKDMKDKGHELIYELNRIDSSLLNRIVPTIEDDLKVIQYIRHIYIYMNTVYMSYRPSDIYRMMLLIYIPKQEEASKRSSAVQLLGKLFAAPKSTAATSFKSLFSTFISMYADKDPQIRVIMMSFSQHVIANHPQLIEYINEPMSKHILVSHDDVRQDVTLTCLTG